MIEHTEAEFSVRELEEQHAAELPSRDLLLTISAVGLPIVGVSGTVGVTVTY